MAGGSRERYHRSIMRAKGPTNMPRLPLALTCMIFGLTLQGCVTNSNVGHNGATATAPTESSAASLPSGSGTAQSTALAQPPAPKLQQPRTPTEAERNPARLVELDPKGVASVIGEPQFVRYEGGAIVWQYNSGGCVMDLYWYRDGEKISLKFMAARGGRLSQQVTVSSCFSDILTGHMAEMADS